MRAHSRVGQLVAAVSRRTPAFNAQDAVAQTFVKQLVGALRRDGSAFPHVVPRPTASVRQQRFSTRAAKRRSAARWVRAILLLAIVGLLLAIVGLDGTAPRVVHWERWLTYALIGLGVSIVAVVSLAWVTRRVTAAPRSSASPSPAPHHGEPSQGGEPSDVPTFRVVALGLNGAGKTVLLASQFHKLSEPVADRRYFLDGDLQQDLWLSMIYGNVADTSAPWPAGTRIGPTHKFLFDCKAFGRAGDERTVFRISYLDYAGDLLETRADEHTATGDLEARVHDAHALLVMIDGQQVLALLRGEHDGHDYFDRRIRPLFGLARRASCPVQLILTKWDLVRSFDDAPDDEQLLRQVVTRLTAYGHIEALVRAHDQRQQEVRLIPVSAVGSQFAELGEDGRVVKRTDGTLDPIHVDMPLCAVLPDALKHVERSLDPSVRTRLDADIGGRVRDDVSSIVSSVLNSHVGKLLRTALRGVVGDEVVKLFVEMLVSKSPTAAPPLEDEEAETQRLRAEVVEHMERVVLLFEAHLPSSTLGRRR